MAETNEAIDAMFAEKRMQPRTREGFATTRRGPMAEQAHTQNFACFWQLPALRISAAVPCAPAHASRLAGGEACS